MIKNDILFDECLKEVALPGPVNPPDYFKRLKCATNKSLTFDNLTVNSYGSELLAITSLTS